MIDKGVVAQCIIEEPGRKVLSLCTDGLIHVATKDGYSWEDVDVAQRGQTPRPRMFDIREVANCIYAVGMGGRVFKRYAPNSWIEMQQGVRMPTEELPESPGFLSIDGFDGKSLYTAGLDGEIWFFNGQRWRQIDSPTSLRLQRVRCLPQGIVYICGAGGVILQGIEDRWSVVHQDATIKTLWGMEFFNGKVYFADNASVYVLEDDELSMIDIGNGEKIDARNLHAADGVLWSVGASSMVMYDGQNWTQIYPKGMSP